MHIFLDMDGVLCNFHRSALKVFGLEYLYDDWPPGVSDIAAHIGLKDTEFWNAIDAVHDFWINIEPMPWMKDLLKLIGHNYTIVTSPSMDPACHAQKVMWMYKYIQPSFRNYFIGPSKHLLAGNGILIDDSEHNVECFRIAGGKAILFPSISNSNAPHDPLNYVKEELEYARTT